MPKRHRRMRSESRWGSIMGLVIRWSSVPLRCAPRPKEGRADPNQSSAFFDGDFEIAAHPHAQVRQWSTQAFFALPSEFGETAEDGADLFRLRCPWRDRHEAMNFDFAQGVDLLQFRQQLVRLKSELGGFSRHIYFQ